MFQQQRDGQGRETALARYSLRVGHLVELHSTYAALVLAREMAEREASEARLAKLEMEIAYNALREEMAERLQAQSHLAYLATHDALTGLPNRTLFSSRFDEAMVGARRQNRKVALLYLDLDNFKDVNDTLGHAIGDALLQNVSARLQHAIRAGETVARLGGDEFALMQIDAVSSAEVSALSERIIELLGKPFSIDKRQIFVGVSIGIAVFPDDAEEVEVLHRNADLALYRAKSTGRNCFKFFDKSMNSQVHRRACLEQALREPTLSTQLRLAFQPQVDLSSERVSGVEALIRWTHPTLGVIAPGEFIPVAERSGLIIEIGAWVLRESCRQAMRWREAGFENLTIAVNVAAAQFQNGDMPRLVADVLAETGLPASWLELEITETGIMHDMRGAAETLIALHQQGVHLAIDDFGTGYSSLSYLRQLPVHRIKIDQSFVNCVPGNVDAGAMVTMIAKLAQALRLEVVAEGVESRAQADFVRDAGCMFAQGYYYGAPAYGPPSPGFITGAYLREHAAAKDCVILNQRLTSPDDQSWLQDALQSASVS
jgi:diguanylate cyclase (GGDEF)-like protein